MKKLYIFIIIGIIIITGFVVFSDRFLESIPEPEIIPQSQKVILIINNGEDVNTFQREFTNGMTAFNLLEQSGLVLETKTYDIGIFIEAIGEKKNGQDGKYWMYYVNGEMPMVSADNMELKLGDRVEFRFEESQF